MDNCRGFLSRIKEPLIYTTIIDIVILIGIISNDERREIFILYLVLVINYLIIVIYLILRHRYYLIKFLKKDNNSIAVSFYDFFKIRNIVVEIENFEVYGKMNVNSFRSNLKTNAKLEFVIAERKYTTAVSQKRFIELYTEYITITKKPIDRRLKIDLNASLMFLDGVLKQKVESIIKRIVPPAD